MFCSDTKPFSQWGRPTALYRPPLVLPGPVSGAHIQQGSRESGTWAGRWVKPKDLSVQEACSGCPLAGPFHELGVWLEPQRFQEGKQKQWHSQETCSALSAQIMAPQGILSMERSVTTSFQCEVMLAPHSTSFFLPCGGWGKGVSCQQPNSACGEAGLP